MSGGGGIIGGVVGAIVGSFIPGVGPQLGWMIGSALGGVLFPGPSIEGPRLSDLRPQGSEYGREIPIVYGSLASGGNVDWAAEYTEVPSEEGGKGGGGVTSYAYFANFGVTICESNGDVTLGRIWAGPEKRLIYDGTNLEGGGTITFYNGAATQLPDPLEEAHKGVGNAPAYRGVARVVFGSFPLENDGRMLPFLTIEVGNVTGSALSLGTVWTVGEVFVDETAGTYSVSYSGSFDGVITRNLSANSFVDSQNHALPSQAGSIHSFYDPDRKRIVYIGGGGRVDWVDVETGTTGGWLSGTWPVPGGASVSGYQAVGGVYHNGIYCFLLHKTSSGAGDAVAISTIDPTTFAGLNVYKGDTAGASSLVNFCGHRQNGDTYILGVTKAGTVRKYPLSASFTSTSIGACMANAQTAAVDPNTGYVWTGKFTAPILDVCANDPVTQTQILSASMEVAATSWALDYPRRGSVFVFKPGSPGEVIVIMEKWLGRDYFVSYWANGSGVKELTEGIYHGTADITAGFWNPSTSEFWFTRLYGWANKAIGGSLSQVALLGNSNTLFPGSGIYLGDRGMTVSGDLLSVVVADLFERAGLTSSEYDVTALASDTVDGYAIARQTSVREAIGVLAQAYFFDIVERNGKLVCVKRGGAIAATIPDEDLGAYEDGSEPDDDLLLTVRQMENELPKSLTLGYINRNSDYNAAVRRAERLIGDALDEQAIDLPLVLTDTKAQGVAETILHQAWVRRRSYKFSLPLKYIYLEPTDLVSIRNQSMMITRVTHRGGVLQCEGFFDDYNYVPNVVVTETPTSGKVVFIPSPTVVEYMDVNMARDADDSLLFYVAAAGYDADTWDGAIVYESVDGGANYSSIATITTAATMGYATNTLGNFTGGNIVDELNVLTVQMLNGTLSSTDAAGLLSGVNQILYGNEWIFYRTATLTATNTYQLKGLLRGRRGTENEIGTHVANERVILWNSAIVQVSRVTADLNVARQYKAVSVGLTLAGTDSEEFTYTGNSLKPHRPVHLGGGRDASNNLTINWTRQNRTSYEWRDSVDVPMTEASEAYSVDIYSNSGYSTVVRTISTTSPTASYPAADQTSDGLTPGNTVYFKVFQLGQVIGRGHVATGSV